MKDSLIVVFGFILFVLAATTLVYLDYTAYRERFPNAAPWTYFFKP